MSFTGRPGQDTPECYAQRALILGGRPPLHMSGQTRPEKYFLLYIASLQLKGSCSLRFNSTNRDTPCNTLGKQGGS